MNRLKQKGSIALFVASGLFLLLGILAIVLEFGYMHSQKNKLQNVADGIALACLSLDSEDACGNTFIRNTSSLKSSNCSSLSPCQPLELNPNTNALISAINTNNFKVETKLPVSCPIKDTACAYAKVSTSWEPIFLKYFMSNVTRFAEATAGGTKIGACFIVKDTLQINGSIDVNLDSCSASIGKRLNTTNNAGIIITSQNNNSGNYQTTIYNNGINQCSPDRCVPTPRIVSAPLDNDPPYIFDSPSGNIFKGIPAGTPNPKGSGLNYTLNPGQYTSGINLGKNGSCLVRNQKPCLAFDTVNIGPGDTVTFNPGTYYVTGDFFFSGSGTVVGEGVSFLIQENTAGNNLFRISGDNVNLRAQSSTECGFNSDLLIFKKPGKTQGNLEVRGNNTLVMEGVLYFPNENLSFSGTATNIDIYGTIIAYNLSTNGNVKNHTAPNNCFNKGTRYKASLVY